VSIAIFSSAAIILIVVSVVVVVVTFFGCCGAIKENKCMLGTYFTVVLVSVTILPNIIFPKLHIFVRFSHKYV
jgi:hypothetical protein